MAHNNGMVPRKGRGKAARSSGMSEGAARFREAADAVPVAPAGDAYDPAPPAPVGGADNQIEGIGNLPLHGATGAELAGFVPHRPARPEKSEGGKRFKLVSEYTPAGDQPTAIRDLVEGLENTDIVNHGVIGERDQVLLGVTGSGKTYTMAQVIERT